MQIRLLDLLCHPWKVSRVMIRALKDMHVNMEVVLDPIKRESVEKHKSGFLTINSTFMIPTGVYEMIKHNIVVIDSQGYGENRVWRRHKNQDVSATHIPYEQAVVMLVNERLDKANGK